jgi:hypothetical protein
MIIQNVAPGPPSVTATPTPAMLPSPTVPDTADVNAWKWLTSPGSSSDPYLPRTSSIACLKPRTWMTPKMIVKIRAAATSHPR